MTLTISRILRNAAAKGYSFKITGETFEEVEQGHKLLKELLGIKNTKGA